jgi:hypothetical protein
MKKLIYLFTLLGLLQLGTGCGGGSDGQRSSPVVPQSTPSPHKCLGDDCSEDRILNLESSDFTQLYHDLKSAQDSNPDISKENQILFSATMLGLYLYKDFGIIPNEKEKRTALKLFYGFYWDYGKLRPLPDMFQLWKSLGKDDL